MNSVQLSPKFVVNADFYSSQLNHSTEVLMRTGNKVVMKQDKSFQDQHSKMRSKHSKANQKGGFEPLGKLHNVQTLYQKYQEQSRTFDNQFDIKKPRKKRRRFDLKLRMDQVKKRVEDTAYDRVKKVLENRRNPRDMLLKQDVRASQQRTQLAKAGSGTAIQFFNDSKNSQASMAPLQKGRTEIFDESVCYTPPELKSYRANQLDEKLDYFCESPTAAIRRLETEHLPWQEQPDVPNDPNVEVFRPAPQRRETIWNRFMVNSSSIRHQCRKSDNPAFLRQLNSFDNTKKTSWNKPDMLGNQGMQILVTVMKDTMKNVSATQGEMNELKQIVLRRQISHGKQQEKEAEKQLNQFILEDAVRSRRVKAGRLVDKYFSFDNSARNN